MKIKKTKTRSLADNIRLFVIVLLSVSFFTAALLFSDQILDYEYLQNGSTWSALHTAIYKTQSYIYGLVSILCLIAGLLLIFGVRKIILDPLKQLSCAIEEFGKEKPARLDLKNTVYEIEALSESFNSMARKIEDLKKTRMATLSAITHELYTPLTSLRGNLEAIQEGVFKANDKIELLIDETIYIQRLINDLKELALAEVGELPLNKTGTNLNTHIRHAAELLEPLFNEKNISVEITQGGCPEAEIDITRFNQILYNLITNSIKYTPVGGKIILSTEEIFTGNKKWVKVSVTDNGPGISQEHLPFVFEQFYRVDKSPGGKTGGSGLGLAIVKRLAEAHGGKVEVKSAPGQGSEFIVYFPS